MTIPIPNYAAQLQGLVLPTGWTVVRPLPRKPGATGGAFSSPYVVEDANGHKAFLKAIDLSTPYMVKDLAAHLERTLRCFRYERDLVTKCGDAKMDRIVRVLESGELYVEPGNASSIVFFLVFEIADGDVHSVLDFARGVDVRWTVRTLHEISIALTQLHQRLIAHQDVKPSNVIMFGGVGSKLGDLGRASTQGVLTRAAVSAFRVSRTSRHGYPARMPGDHTFNGVAQQSVQRTVGRSSALAPHRAVAVGPPRGSAC